MLENLKQSTLSATMSVLRGKGYTEDFEIDENGLYLMGHKEKYYQPDAVRIVSVIRFEGASDPSDTAALYIIELEDGTKGQVIDAYGVYANKQVGEFIKQCRFDYDASTEER